MKNEDFNSEDKKVFMDFQKIKWIQRRRMAWLTIISYLGLAFYLVWKSDSENFGNYEGYFTQLTFFAITVIMMYFGGSSYEEVYGDKKQFFDEYVRFSQNRRGSRGNGRPMRREQPSEPEEENEVG